MATQTTTKQTDSRAEMPGRRDGLGYKGPRPSPPGQTPGSLAAQMACLSPTCRTPGRAEPAHSHVAKGSKTEATDAAVQGAEPTATRDEERPRLVPQASCLKGCCATQPPLGWRSRLEPYLEKHRQTRLRTSVLVMATVLRPTHSACLSRKTRHLRTSFHTLNRPLLSAPGLPQ